jgi:hypothetical protein
VDRDDLRRFLRAVRDAGTADEAWSRIVPAFPRLGAEAVRLTWVREPSSSEDRRASVFFWRTDTAARWPLDRAEAHPHARVVPLAGEGRALGELVVVFRRGVDPKGDPELLVVLELLAEALIEHRLATVREGDAEVVDFWTARRQQMSAGV